MITRYRISTEEIAQKVKDKVLLHLQRVKYAKSHSSFSERKLHFNIAWIYNLAAKDTQAPLL